MKRSAISLIVLFLDQYQAPAQVRDLDLVARGETTRSRAPGTVAPPALLAGAYARRRDAGDAVLVGNSIFPVNIPLRPAIGVRRVVTARSKNPFAAICRSRPAK